MILDHWNYGALVVGQIVGNDLFLGGITDLDTENPF